MSQPIFFFDDNDADMQRAYLAARESFRYFWRELSWESMRIVPGLDMSMVKIPFTDGPRTDGQSEFEQMWVGDIEFDGDSLSGTLLNSPNWLGSVCEGDAVSVPFGHLTDWMMTANGRAYGGFTVNLMRSRMSRKERDAHDQAWGLEFGDPAEIQIEVQRSPKPKAGRVASLIDGLLGRGSSQPAGFEEHPMCLNVIPEVTAQLKADPSIARTVGDDGWTQLHRDALSGNFGLVKLLVESGADTSVRTPNGYTAADLARLIGWSVIADYCDGHS